MNLTKLNKLRRQTIQQNKTQVMQTSTTNHVVNSLLFGVFNVDSLQTDF